MFFINVVFGMAAVAFMDRDWPYGLMFLFIALVMLSIPVFNGRGRRHEEGANGAYATRIMRSSLAVRRVALVRPRWCGVSHNCNEALLHLSFRLS